jgi:hypothetical protein
MEDAASFYQREEVTTTYPNENPSGQPLRIMKYSRKRTYNMFRDEFPTHKISKTIFDSIKPKSVKLMKHAKWLQCLCDICDNVTMVCRAIKLSMQRSNMVAPAFLSDELLIAKETVCSFNNFHCLDRACLDCDSSKLGESLHQWVSDNPSDQVKYTKWERVTESHKGTMIKKLRKIEKLGYRWELLNELSSYLTSTPCICMMLLHSFRHLKNASLHCCSTKQ